MTIKLGPDGISRFPHISGMSPRTMKLIERLKTMKPGDAVSDAELTTVAGASTAVGGDAYANLMSACRYVLRHEGIVLERVVGAHVIKCLNGPETVTSVERGRERIGRRVRREVSKLRVVDVSQLPAGEKTTALVLRAQLGALSTYSSAGTAKKLAASPDLESWQERQRKMLKSM
jgi:hypothetical protein